VKRGLPDCPKCPYRGPSVGSRGNPEAPVVYVGEGPGIQELRKGIPFVGSSGKLLWYVTPGGEEADVYTTNATMCLPLNKEDNPSRFNQALSCCQDRLLKEVQAYPRRLIIALGRGAAVSLTGNTNLKITQERGRLIESHLAELGILPIVHPAALLHGGGSFRQLREDVAYGFELLEGKNVRPFIEPSMTVCETPKQIEAAINILIKQPLLAADTETSGFSCNKDRILCLGVAHKDSHTYVFPEEVMGQLGRLFKTKKPQWLWQNGKFDMGFLRAIGLPSRVDDDAMLQSYCLDEVPGVHDLEQIGADVLKAPSYKHIVKQWAPKKTDSYEKVPKPILFQRVATDAAITFGVAQVYRKRVARDRHSEKLYTRVLIPASELLFHVERAGLLIDKEQVRKNHDRLKAVVDSKTLEINELAGRPVNPASPAQMETLLFDHFKIKTRRRNTRKETLERLPQLPIVKALRAYRKVAKALSTDVLGLEKHIEGDGRVHTTFLLHGTPTGRLASRQPNVQNVQRDKDLRNQYVAPEGYVLVKVDENQAELRSLAALSGDEFLCDIYNSQSMSLHDEVAKARFGESFTSEERMRAKAVNFGIPYGREAPSLAEEFGTSVAEEQQTIDVWFERAPKAHDFILKCRRAALKGGTIITAFGRKRRFTLVTRKMIKHMMNEAANFPHQSTASDICLISAIETRKAVEKLGARIVNLVHDEIVTECPDDSEKIAEVVRLISAAMRRVPKEWGITRVPFTANGSFGKSWGNLKAWC